MKKTILLLLLLSCSAMAICQSRGEAVVKKTSDFTISGSGSAKEWDKASWITLPLRAGDGKDLTTRVKMLYSEKGIYFLFDCKDKKLTSTMNADFMDLWTEDVVEVFLWSDERYPYYFEYEISPLGYELPLLISNNDGELLRWMPFHYEENRKTIHATAVRGGEKKSNAAVSGWTAEFFFPYKLLKPMDNSVPKSGMKWRANMYRVDYDDNSRNNWAWQPVTKTFHDYMRFGTLVFE